MLNSIKTKITREVVFKSFFALVFSYFNISIYMLQNKLLQSKIDYHIMIVNIFLLAIIVYVVLTFVFRKLSNTSVIEDNTKYISLKKYFFIVFVIHIICWLPIFLAYYPGNFTYDVKWQMPQYYLTYKTHHPLIHTLYLHFFYYKIGPLIKNYTLAIALSSLCQMIFFAISLSFMHTFVYKLRVNKKIRYAMVVISSLLAIFPALAITSTKDIFFSAFVVIYVTLLGYYCCFKNEFLKIKFLILFIIASCGVILFRNNGIYPIIACTIYVIFDNLKKRKIIKTYKPACVSVFGMVIGIIISNLLVIGLHAYKNGFNEALSLPYQQISLAYLEHKHEINDKYTGYVKTIIPSVEKYKPHLSDPVKRDAKGTKNVKLLVKTYAKFIYKFPYSYLNAFSLLNAGYLSFTDTTYASIYAPNRGSLYSGYCYPMEDNSVVAYSFAPKIKNIYQKLFPGNKFQKIILLNKMLHPALYFWITMFFFLVVCCKKIYILMPIFVFISILLLTILAGPCCLMRYALPYISCLPVLISCVFSRVNIKLDSKTI